MAKKKAKVIRLERNKFTELESLARRGRLFPEAVVQFARDPGTLLHKSFEWDDTKAARKYRIEQAREVIQGYLIVVDGPTGPQKVRAFYSLPSDRGLGGGYRRTQDIIKDKRLLAELVKSALTDLERVRAQYEAVRALAPIWSAADRVAARLGSKRAKAAA